MHFHSVKISFYGFAVLFQISLAHCDKELKNEVQILRQKMLKNQNLNDNDLYLVTLGDWPVGIGASLQMDSRRMEQTDV